MWMEFCGLMIFSVPVRSYSTWTGSPTPQTGSTNHCTELTLPGTPVCLSLYLSACLSLGLCASLSVFLPVYVHVYLGCLFVCLSVCLGACLSDSVCVLCFISTLELVLLLLRAPSLLLLTVWFLGSILYLCRYKRRGSSALGLDSRTQGVCWEDSAPDRKRKEKRDERYFSPSNHRHLSFEAPPTLSAPPTDSSLISPSTNSASFIPLPPCKEASDSTPQTGTSTDPLRVYDLATSLWLEGKGQPEVKSQVQLPPSNTLMGRVEEFNRKLRENPTDINMWLEFIRFQVDFC